MPLKAIQCTFDWKRKMPCFTVSKYAIHWNSENSHAVENARANIIIGSKHCVLVTACSNDKLIPISLFDRVPQLSNFVFQLTTPCLSHSKWDEIPDINSWLCTIDHTSQYKPLYEYRSSFGKYVFMLPFILPFLRLCHTHKGWTEESYFWNKMCTCQ